MEWYRKDKTAVAEGLRRGERPDLATTMATGPLDELVALHEELGIFSGAASEKGKEAQVTRELLEQLFAVAGPDAISLLLADALYADGPLLAWLKYGKGIDALVSLPEDRLLYQDVQGLAEAHLIAWTHHLYVRTVQGHKHIREVEVTEVGNLTSWDSFLEAAASYGVTDASLWACLIHDVTTQQTAQEASMGLVSTRRWPTGFAALQAYRPRWHIEDDIYRELTEGCCHRPCHLDCSGFQYRSSLSFASGTTSGFRRHSTAAPTPPTRTGRCSSCDLPR